MIGAEKRQVLAHSAVARSNVTICGPSCSPGKAVGAEVFGIEHVGARALVLVLDAELLEQAQYELVDRAVGVDRGERAVQQLQPRFALVGQFQQAVAARRGSAPTTPRARRASRRRSNRSRRRCPRRRVRARRPARCRRSPKRLYSSRPSAGLLRNASRPASYQRTSACCALPGNDGDVDVDVAALADAVEPADALLEQVRIERQVPQDQVVRELEIAAFRTDLGAQQQARAVGLGEIRGVAIALHDRHRLVETRELDAAARAQRFFEREHLGLAAADQQEFFVRVALEQIDQPGQARIVGVVESRAAPAAAARRTGTRRADAGGNRRRSRAPSSSVTCRMRCGKPPTVARRLRNIDAAGAVAVDQRIEHGARGATVGLPSAASAADSETSSCRIVPSCAAARHRSAAAHSCNLSTMRDSCDVAFGLVLVAFQIAVARRVEQAQAGEMAGAAELFRRRRQQDQVRRRLRAGVRPARIRGWSPAGLQAR